MKKIIAKTLLLVSCLLITAMADIKPSGLFVDHMVIQRETQAPIWGIADPGEKVIAEASWGAMAETTADANGKWILKLQTPKAGGPHKLTLQGKNKIELKDILSGDVWLCSGQSNMAWPVSKSLNPQKDISEANYPQIRSFTVNRKTALSPQEECDGLWEVCSPQTVEGFSATAFYTGRELYKELNVPIGLLTSAWGGTIIEAWTPWAEQSNDPFAIARKAPIDQKAKGYNPETAKANYEKKLALWNKEKEESTKGKKGRSRKPTLATDPRLSQNYPANLYNGMIHPLRHFAIKGAVWYQGESNAQKIETAIHYRNQLTTMIKSWRKVWGIDFPFYSVQLPNFKKQQNLPVEHENIWPAIRESFVKVTENIKNSYTICTIDLGEAKDIHPKNKQDVGKRMASTILNKTYNKKTPTTPFMKSHTIDGNKVIIELSYSGSGLIAKDGPLKAFAIAGEDQKFIWADAKIIRKNGTDYVVVSSPEVSKPSSVRYAWADNPATCNLYSKEGFPASPFRTDTWIFQNKSENK